MVTNERPPEPFVLREYDPMRVEELVWMWRRAFEQAVGVTDPHPISEQIEYFTTQVLPTSAIAILEHERTRTIAAFMASSVDTIHQLYVAIEFQRRGLGSYLVDIAKLRSNGILRLYTFQSNERAKQFYERHGFIAIEHGFEPNWKLEDVLYEWRALA
jgi:ribosomal protein S18 acetylase RimI-like enzyme